MLDAPELSQRVNGQILVTRMTDPGWIFLITQAGGIIAEKGSLLSHTAIIGRELGIPTVVGVKGGDHLAARRCPSAPGRQCRHGGAAGRRDRVSGERDRRSMIGAINYLVTRPWFQRFADQRSVARWFGRLADSRRLPQWLLRRIIRAYCRSFAIRPDDFVFDIDGPLTTFNAFFTRPLKPGARPVAAGIVAPADGYLSAWAGWTRA